MTNDPKKENIRLVVEANFLENLSVMPRYLYFEQIPTGLSDTKTITLSNKSKDVITITRIIPSNPEHIFLNVKAPLDIKPGEEKRIELMLKASKFQQHFAGAVQFIMEKNKPPLEKTVVIRADFIQAQPQLQQ